MVQAEHCEIGATAMEARFGGPFLLVLKEENQPKCLTRFSVRFLYIFCSNKQINGLDLMNRTDHARIKRPHHMLHGRQSAFAGRQAD